MVVLEAMAASKPVVATEVPGTAEAVINEKTGLLVPLRNSGKLADSIKRLLRDKKLSQNMGKAGRGRVEKYFSVAKMVDDTETLYNDLMKSKGFT